MTTSTPAPDQYDRQFWRIRHRLIKQAGNKSLIRTAEAEIARSAENAERHASKRNKAAARGEQQRIAIVRSVMDFQRLHPPDRAHILRERAHHLRQYGTQDAAALLETEANNILLDYFLNMHPQHRSARNATQILQFATRSLQTNPSGPDADKLRRIIRNAKQIIDGFQPGHRHPADHNRTLARATPSPVKKSLRR